ncbi:MAG: DoxX family protein [Flavobacteriales bacterium]
MTAIRKLFSSQSWNTDLAALLLRVVFGGLMLWLHGHGKLMKWDEYSVKFAEPFGMPSYLSAALTIFAEFFCCILIVLGLFTRLSAVPIIICMAVAAFNIHWADSMHDKEASLTYMGAFIAIFILGGGKYSVDYLLSKKA